MALIAGTSLLTYTTSPIVLTDAIEQLLKPLGRLHFPVHELAMMMSIALRFIPTLIEETDKIMNAQKARGAQLDNGKMTERIRAQSGAMPLSHLAFHRADSWRSRGPLLSRRRTVHPPQGAAVRKQGLYRPCGVHCVFCGDPSLRDWCSRIFERDNLSVTAIAVPPPLIGEALAFRKAFPLRQRLPSLGELSSEARLRGWTI